ncbi:hypothetical protein CONCODRAFT_7342 [Conidiobolus coronatus NRRL 28638]|uniref:Tr-type G domain-containing protein n=1 Tax=Conidiobolus coronatus (strain ATCC 28846 / CBS 209.66 / NRRL 28638) TaxID=796925 RepID=A0A137P521_CONC2|nr:hypothetical protein CONCODRAFT_7342 [Conidiobolus coronatus NRRL 28638]|eukprot:KXN70106.1 hypothetical protein CONCODRAFT_7342 [Conidiobolus coronatus NRRL 28638]
MNLVKGGYLLLQRNSGGDSSQFRNRAFDWTNLISILLSIIQDCPNDIQALDRSFTNLSLQHKSSQKPIWSSLCISSHLLLVITLVNIRPIWKRVLLVNLKTLKVALPKSKLQIQISEDLAKLEGHLISASDVTENTKSDLIKIWTISAPERRNESCLSKLLPPEKIRNIAIIAHVDHAKTTLVDCLSKLLTKVDRDAPFSMLVTQLESKIEAGTIKVGPSIKALDTTGKYGAEFKNDTHGEGVLNHVFSSYQTFKRSLDQVRKGSLISTSKGDVTTYAAGLLEPRGKLFDTPDPGFRPSSPLLWCIELEFILSQLYQVHLVFGEY